MRVLVTGGRGFVAAHAMAALRSLGPSVEVIGTARGEEAQAGSGMRVLDVTDPTAVRIALREVRPTHVLNLAGVAAPAAANRDWRTAWAVNVDGPLALADAMKAEVPDAMLVQVGTGLAYGGAAKSGAALSETACLDPLDVYGASKAAADFGLGALARLGHTIIRLRPFNHTGPGQSTDYVVPAFADQIARIEAGLLPPVVKVGDLSAERDFLDVRDVARAYALVIARSDTLPAGTVLNIASGVPRRMSDLLDALIARAHTKVTVVADPTRMRPSDVPRIVGDASRARAALGWSPEISFEQMIDDVLGDCRRRVARSR